MVVTVLSAGVAGNRFEANFVTYFSRHVLYSTGDKDMRKESLRNATEVPLYGILLFGEKVQDDLAHGVPVGRNSIVLSRSWSRIGVLGNALRELFGADLRRSRSPRTRAGRARW